jgi:hypothetical protein
VYALISPWPDQQLLLLGWSLATEPMGMTGYKIGYGKPPKATQLKKGTSGNPKGRPKGSLNLSTDLAAELSEQITLREGGRSRRVSKQRALIKSLLAKALQGDVRATTAVLALYARVITEPAEEPNDPIEIDEVQILRRFVPRLLKSIQPKRGG